MMACCRAALAAIRSYNARGSLRVSLGLFYGKRTHGCRQSGKHPPSRPVVPSIIRKSHTLESHIWELPPPAARGINPMRRIRRLIFAFLAPALLFAPSAPAQDAPSPQLAPFDLIITHGHIIDGTGSPWYSGDIGIRDGHIAAIGNLSAAPAKRTIDAHGDVDAPGFIDMLGQSEMTILVDPRLPSKICQGITTEITGEGNSIAPLNNALLAADRAGYEHYKVTPDWRTFRQYFARIEKQGM